MLVIRVMALSDLDLSAVKASGHAYAMTTNTQTNRAYLRYQISTRTGPDGSYESLVNVTGRVVVVARPRGDFCTTFAERESIEQDVSDLDLVAKPGDGRTTRVVRSGVPFHGKLFMVDTSRADEHSRSYDFSRSNEFFVCFIFIRYCCYSNT